MPLPTSKSFQKVDGDAADYSLAPGGRSALLQLVGFTSRPNESLSMVVERRWRSASMHVIGAEAPVSLEPQEVEGNLEYHLRFATVAR